MFIKFWGISTAILLVASCGGNTNDADTDSPFGTNTPAAPSQMGPSFDQEAGVYISTVNGVEFETSTIFRDNRTNQPILNQSVLGPERHAFIAIEGEYVDGFGGSYSNDASGIQDFAFYALTGSPTQSLGVGTVQYTGSYMTADASNPNAAVFSYQAELSVNYETGVISGNTLYNGGIDSNVSFAGNVNGNNVEVTINDQYGTHTAVGAIYGPTQEEIAAGFDDGVISGLLYGAQ